MRIKTSDKDKISKYFSQDRVLSDGTSNFRIPEHSEGLYRKERFLTRKLNGSFCRFGNSFSSRSHSQRVMNSNNELTTTAYVYSILYLHSSINVFASLLSLASPLSLNTSIKISIKSSIFFCLFLSSLILSLNLEAYWL